MTDLTNVPAPAFFPRWLVYALLIAGLITAWFMAMTVNPHATSRITTVAVFLAPLSIPWIIATVRRHRSRLAIVALNVIVMALVCPFLSEWCRRNRHLSLRDQHAHLSQMMRGHYAYYGISGNSRRIRWFACQVVVVWRKWLSRRDRQGGFQ